MNQRELLMISAWQKPPEIIYLRYVKYILLGRENNIWYHNLMWSFPTFHETKYEIFLKNINRWQQNMNRKQFLRRFWNLEEGKEVAGGNSEKLVCFLRVVYPWWAE